MPPEFGPASIFVQIAAYRDPQLIPTVEDLLARASRPELFAFGICWQYGPEELPSLGAFDGRAGFRVRKVPFAESRGLGWARSVTNSLHAGEPYTLQIDSHHRFLQGWDDKLLEDYAQALEASDKPIVTTYVPPFEVGRPLPAAAAPSLMSQYEFSSDRLLMSMPWYVPDHEALTRVIRARTISGHFYFASAAFIAEVPYDPEAFFGGYVEEVTLSARAWTHGWDFFSPHRCYLYHEYTRSGRPKIWEDKPEDTGAWDATARRRARQLQGQEQHGLDLGAYGLGSRRSFRDWEVFAGFDFAGCRLHQYTLEVREPPNPLPWEDGFASAERRVRVAWDAAKLREDAERLSEGGAAPAELVCLTLGFETASGLCVHRADMTPATHPAVFSWCDEQQSDVEVLFRSSVAPTRWVIWPIFRSATCDADGTVWGTRQEGAANCEP